MRLYDPSTNERYSPRLFPPPWLRHVSLRAIGASGAALSVDSSVLDEGNMERDVHAEASVPSTHPPLPPGSDPLASSLDRDALLAYAYHLYERPENIHAGLTTVPLDEPRPNPIRPNDVYKLHLLPLLIALRSLHPEDLPVLLLMSCTYHALGDYDASLRVSQGVLDINPTFVSSSRRNIYRT